jgi:lia operon protein LiaH
MTRLSTLNNNGKKLRKNMCKRRDEWMKTLLERIKTVVLADLHEVLDNKERKNPIALLNQYLRECEHEVKKVEKLLERHHVLKEEFYREWKHAEYMAEKRKKQAEIARKANEPALYEMALTEQKQYEERVISLKQAYEKTIDQLDELEQKYREMKLKLKDMHMKRLELMGRENVARVTQKINHMMERSDIGEAYSRFDEIERYIENLESRVNYNYQKSMFDYHIAQLEKQLKTQETIQSRVE